MGRFVDAVSVSPFCATTVVLLVIVWSSPGHGDLQDPTNGQFNQRLDPTVAIARNSERFRGGEDGEPQFLAGLDFNGDQKSSNAFQARSKKEKRRMPFRSDLGKRLLSPKYALQLPVVLEEEDSEWREVKGDDEKRGKRYRNFKSDLGKRLSQLDGGFADDIDAVAGLHRAGYQMEDGQEEDEDEEEEGREDQKGVVDLSKRRMFRSDLG